MTSFLFWNTHHKPLETIISNLAATHQVDILMLTECAILPQTLLKALNRDGQARYHYSSGFTNCKKIELFTRFSEQFIRPIHENDRLTIRHLRLPGIRDILLSVLHFPSKLHWSEASQAQACIPLADTIRRVEEQVGHARTILVGDFNMNPFEDGMVSALGLHGVMSQQIAQKRTREVNGREYAFFYNPMWSLLGDATPYPPGTYYYSNAEPNVFFWNMFDQVLLRPDLLETFNHKHLEILTSDGKISFLSPNGLPRKNTVSDHLPVLFKLSL